MVLEVSFYVVRMMVLEVSFYVVRNYDLLNQYNSNVPISFSCTYAHHVSGKKKGQCIISARKSGGKNNNKKQQPTLSLVCKLWIGDVECAYANDGASQPTRSLLFLFFLSVKKREMEKEAREDERVLLQRMNEVEMFKEWESQEDQVGHDGGREMAWHFQAAALGKELNRIMYIAP